MLAYSNVSTDCSVDDACGGGDNFRQLFYTVRLKYQTTNPTADLDFYLDYASVSAEVILEVTGTGPLYSQIDAGITQKCTKYGPGVNWTETMVNVESPYAADIFFLENSVNTCDGDKIHFTAGSCTGGYYCAYADLFIVVVNAYPGETVQLKLTDAVYDPSSGSECDLPLNYADPVTVAAPDAPTSAPNSLIVAQLADPVTNADGGCDIEVELVNAGTDQVFISYMEFMVKITLDPSMPPFDIDSYYDHPPVKVGNDYYVRFTDVNGTYIAGSTTISLGTITLNPPVIQNQVWSATVVLVDETKSRLKTSYPTDPDTYFCSRLRMDTNEQSCEGGTDCDYDVVFKIWAPENASSTCPSEKIVKVGLTSSTLTYIYLRRLAFELHFDLSDGADISDVTTNDLCTATVASDCFDFMGSTESDCWKTENGGVFKFCFDVTNETNPVTLDVSGDGAYLEIEFNTDGCINGVSIVFVDMISESPYADCPPTQAAIPDPFVLCEPEIFGKVATEYADGELEDAEITLQQLENESPCTDMSCPPETEITGPPGEYSFCPCLSCTKFEVTPEKDNDPLNGVSTFDLVLINKHILGLELLNSPYKMIAADANRSNSITTGGDIVELRKLILGQYTQLPNNTSWRFVPEDYSFPNPASPFATIFPETATLDLSSNPSQEVNFVAIKVGDVNGNAVTQSIIDQVTTLAIPAPRDLPVAGVITLPVKYTGAEKLEAIQLGLRFDPKKLRLIGPSQGDLPGYDSGNFGLTNVGKGEIRTLWFADPTVPDAGLNPGDVLFYLSFEVKSPVEPSRALLELDDALLQNVAWESNGEAFSLKTKPASEDRIAETTEVASLLQGHCYPNPTNGELNLTVSADRESRARLAIFGPFGSLEWTRDVTLEAGEQTFSIPDIARLPAGVYFWKVLTPWAKTQGHLIKQ